MDVQFWCTGVVFVRSAVEGCGEQKLRRDTLIRPLPRDQSAGQRKKWSVQLMYPHKVCSSLDRRDNGEIEKVEKWVLVSEMGKSLE